MPLSRDQVLATLKAHEAELRARGVARIALFGSLARGDARADSDVDLMVEINPDARLDLGSYEGWCYSFSLFYSHVDVADCAAPSWREVSQRSNMLSG